MLVRSSREAANKVSYLLLDIVKILREIYLTSAKRPRGRDLAWKSRTLGSM